MKVTTEARWKSMSDFIAGKPADFEQYFDYYGPTGKLDRAASEEAKQAEETSAADQAQEAQAAASERAMVLPFYSSEMKTTHGLTPGQNNEVLTAEASGIGGAAGAEDENAKLQGVRTRNASGFTKALDEAARERTKAAAGGAEAGAAKDVELAKQENQAGAAGISSLFGEDLGMQAKEQQIQNQDINTQIEAGKSGWLQNLNQLVNTASDSANLIGK